MLDAVYQAESAADQPDLITLEPSSRLVPHLYVDDFDGSFHPCKTYASETLVLAKIIVIPNKS